MKDVIVRANKISGDGHYDVSYPDGRRLVFDIKDGHWDDSKPAYIEIPEFEEGEQSGVRQEPVRIVLESEQDRFTEYDDYLISE